MQAANTLSHQLPGEAAFGDRERQQGVNWTWAAENIGETSDQTVNGALGLHQAMMNEHPPNDGHRQNILNTSGNIVGIAILIDQQHGLLWLTEDFAHVWAGRFAGLYSPVSDVCFSTIYKDNTLCYTSTKVEDLPYSWLPRNYE